MAHFARIGQNNVVTEVLVVNNGVIQNASGDEDETLGVAFLFDLTGHPNWVQTSYNGNFRGCYAGIGFSYDPVRDVFIPPQPYPSWVLDTATCQWIAPVAMPTQGAWRWDEPSVSWVSFDPDAPPQ